MGWIISCVLLAGIAFTKGFTFSGDAILIASGLFAIAGSLGGAANIIVNKIKKENNEQNT